MTINVTNISPAPGSTLVRAATLSFDVTFSPAELAEHVVQLAFDNAAYELAFDGSGFKAPYASSSRQAISGGYRYTIRRTGSWPGIPVVDVRAIGMGPGVAESFTPVLVLDKNARQTVVADDLDDEGAIQLAFAASGHIPGAQKTILIPAGRLASSGMLRYAADLDPTGIWDPIDVAKDYAIFATALSGTQAGAMGRNLGTRTTAAPTVVSATVDGSDPDKLVVVFSAPALFPGGAVTGLSLTGTAITIASVVSGNGTDTVTFDLSADFTGSETASFVVGSGRTAHSLNYNTALVATSTMSITLTGFVPASLAACAAWTRCYESAVQQLPSAGLPATFTSWTDQVGGSLQITKAGAGTPQRTSEGAIAFTNDATQRCKGAVSGFGSGDFAIFARFKYTSGSLGIPVAFDEDGAASVWIYIAIDNNSIDVSIFDGSDQVTLTDVFTTGTGYHSVWLERSGTTVTLRVDNRTPVTTTTSKNLSAITNVSLGNLVYAGPTPYQPLTGAVSDIAWKAAAASTTQERADVAARIAGR